MPAPTANACTAPTPTRPIASTGPWIPSLLPPPPALAANLIIGVGHSAWWQIVLASTPAYSHRSLPPSALSCARQFLRSCKTLLPPGVEPAERALRHQTPSRATTLPTRTDGATQIGSQHASQTKLLHGLTSSRFATIFAVHARLIVHATRLNFHVYGWAPGPC